MADRLQHLRQQALELDAADSLAPLRAGFDLPRGIYCCGHSLGPRPSRAAACVQEILDTWGERAVEGHLSGDLPWAKYATVLAAPSARLCGADAGEVTIAHSLSVNLHLLLASFYRPRGGRRRILIEKPAFPSDRYAVASQICWRGLDPAVELIQSDDVMAGIAEQGERLALVLVGAVNYYTGEALDVAAITAAAHAAGAVAGFDLAHAIGNVPMALHAAGADFAVWCGYKYLCGGPGAPAGMFVHERHASHAGGAPALPRLAGWWGNRADTRFEMREAFEPEAGAAGWNVSSPALLALAGLKAGLDVYEQAAPEVRIAKGRALSAAFVRWSDEMIPGIRRVTPADPTARGAQWSLDLGADVACVHRALRSAGIYSDTRGPILRLSFHPFYNRFQDVAAVIEVLAQLS